MNDTLQNVIIYFASKLGGISQTRLMKLCYLADHTHFLEHGKTITDVAYKHYHYGPFSPAIYNEVEEMLGEELTMESVKTLEGYEATIYKLLIDNPRIDLPDNTIEILKKVAEEWREVDLDEIVKYIKTNPPFAYTSFGDTIDFTTFKVYKALSETLERDKETYDALAKH